MRDYVEEHSNLENEKKSLSDVVGECDKAIKNQDKITIIVSNLRAWIKASPNLIKKEAETRIKAIDERLDILNKGFKAAENAIKETC